MARVNIEDMKVGDRVDSTYLVIDKSKPKRYRDSKKSGMWFEVMVQDATGTMKVIYWGSDSEDIMPIYESFSEGDIIRIVGGVGEYRDEVLINVSSKDGDFIEMTEDENIYDYLLSVEKVKWLNVKLDDLIDEFWKLVNSIENGEIARLVRSFFEDEEFWNEFVRAPASMKVHSAYMHGLLHHTVNVARIADGIAERYPSVDRDLVIGGALLHDIGKVREYELSYRIFETDEGGLFGHIFIGAEMVNERCKVLEINDGIRKKLVHIILSHHGKVNQGFGSARDPMFPEAAIVAMADLADATTFMYVNALEGRRGSDSGERFWKEKYLGWLYMP